MSNPSYNHAINAIATALNEDGTIVDEAMLRERLPLLINVTGTYVKDIAMGLVDAGMDGDLACQIAFNIHSWL